MSSYVSLMCGSLLSFRRLSKEITDVEENIPNVVKFRAGQTKVDDVKKVYLTGQYRQKYRTMSENNKENLNSWVSLFVLCHLQEKNE